MVVASTYRGLCLGMILRRMYNGFIQRTFLEGLIPDREPFRIEYEASIFLLMERLIHFYITHFDLIFRTFTYLVTVKIWVSWPCVEEQYTRQPVLCLYHFATIVNI